MRKNKIIIPVISSFLYIFACIIAFTFYHARPETDQFSSMFIAMLTMPWILLQGLLYVITASIFNYTLNDLVWYISFVTMGNRKYNFNILYFQ